VPTALDFLHPVADAAHGSLFLSGNRVRGLIWTLKM
jgi:hypothetical protein